MFGVSKRYLVRSLAVALVLAMAGFCYATRSSVRSIDAPDAPEAPGLAAGVRLVGTTPLRFTNAIFQGFLFPQPNIYDLGDAAYGSTVTRYITANGGVRPYNFTAFGLDATVLAYSSSLTQEPSGYLIGSVAQGTVSPLFFQTNVTDSFGTQPNTLPGVFRLNLVVVPPSAFRYAVDRVNNGVAGKSHASKLETLGGIGVQHTVLPNTLTVAGIPQGPGDLAQTGLEMSSDGTIFGRPLKPGLVSFTAMAKDVQNRIANDRTDSVKNQVITFNVEDNQTATTDFTTLDCHIQGDVGQFGKDSISFSGLVNLSGTQFVLLQGTTFVLHVGKATFSGFLNFKGQVVNIHGGPVIYADRSQLKASVNPRTGQVSGTVKHASLYGNGWKDLLNVQDRTTKRVGVMVNFAHFVLGSDMLEFATRRSGDRFALDYKMGSIGRPLGGAFQIIGVKGANKRTISGQPGVAWTARFIAIPRYGIDANAGLDAISALRVRMGNNFTQTIAGKFFTSSAGGTIQLAKLPFKVVGPNVSKFSYSTRKFVGMLQTQPLAVLDTGVPQATAVASANFTLALDVLRTGNNTNFYGEISRYITTYPKLKSWDDQSHAPR